MSDEYYLDRAAENIRYELAIKIREVVHQNEECFIALWCKQNPEANLKDYVLVHGFDGLRYTF